MDAAAIARTSISFSEVRVYGPTAFQDEEVVVTKEERDRLRLELLAKIESCYGRVKLLPGVFDSGFCFGLLDPASNVVAGVAIARAVSVDGPDSPVPAASFPKRRKPNVIGDMNQRSLDGLVAFLAALFPHLTEANAMWYLVKAKLDPLVAARLVIRHRGMEHSFGFSSDATVAAVETALRCAAAAAQHPCPAQFASGWKSLSHSLDKVAAVLSGSGPSDHSHSIDGITDVLLKKPQPSDFSLEKPWDLASRRLHNLSQSLVSPPERSTLRRLLLTTIHGYYLQALARLPREKLRSQYHHSLLQADHCYGPLDPVSNIILNTIWYSRAYPLTKKVDLEAISSRGLLRIAVRSLHGLVSFLCTRGAATHLTPEEAMQRLQEAGADLRIADPNQLCDYDDDDDDDDDDDAMVVSVPASVEQAYAAAAAAALHPKPCEQAELLRPSNPMLRMASKYLKDGGKLSGADADHVAEGLFYSISECPEQTEHPEASIKVVNKLTYTRMDGQATKFWDQHAGVVGTVKSLIDVYNRRQLGVPKYELHVICGVNAHVDSPVYMAPFTGTYPYSHINFLATQSAGTPPTLFFAECRNDNDGGSTQDMGWCCPVAVPSPGTEQVRCLYCEYNGSRIVHPAQGGFHGRGRDFEKMWGGEEVYSKWHTNDSIIKRGREAAYWVDYLEDDCIYNTYRLDDKRIGPKVVIHKERSDGFRAAMLKKGLAFTKDMVDAIKEHMLPLPKAGLIDDEGMMDLIEDDGLA